MLGVLEIPPEVFGLALCGVDIIRNGSGVSVDPRFVPPLFPGSPGSCRVLLAGVMVTGKRAGFRFFSGGVPVSWILCKELAKFEIDIKYGPKR
jgi:hypothetical protein